MKSFCPNFKIIFFVIFFFGLFGLAKSSWAADRYVDNVAPCSGAACNGTTWGKAWKTFGDITGLSAGDTVYISGGSTSQTYSFSGTSYWDHPAGGSQGNPITYKAGQDAGHNGMVIFDGTGITNPAYGFWVVGGNWVTLDGGYNGQRHFTVQKVLNLAVYSDNSTGLVLRYITVTGPGFRALNSTQFEVDHCYLDATPIVDAAIKVSSGGTPGWDVNKIHDSTLIMYRDNINGGDGDDGIQPAGSSISIYNNSFKSKITSNYYPACLPNSCQHQDGVQLTGNYVKIYNNIFENVANSCIDLNQFGDSSNVLVYNNVCFMSDAALAGSNGGIEIYREGGANGTFNFTNYIVANNTVANFPGAPGIGMFDVGGQGLAVYDSSDKFYNNVACNASLEVDSNISGHNDASNKNLRGTCGGSFVAYQELSSNSFVYDFHLASRDTTLKDAGTPMATYFTTDKDGVTRPQGSAWDTGAYEYVGGGDTTPPAAPTGLSVN